MKNGDTRPKSVLITGATDGLGKALALLLAERGYRVFAAGRSAEKRAQLDGLAREKKLALESTALDVCSDASVQSTVQTVLAKAGAIDVLVNNAGVNYTAAVEDLSMEDWRAQFDTNFFGVLRVTRTVLPHMRERRSGRVLMMSSLSGLVTPPTQGAYSSSKHALEGLSNALREVSRQRERHARQIQNHTGRLRPRHAARHRDVEAKAALRRHISLSIC